MRRQPLLIGSTLLLLLGGSLCEMAHAASAMTCDSYARNYAQNGSRQGQVIGRGAVGSLLGAGIGAAFDGAGVGAAIGAGVGVISGGSSRRRTAEQMYNAAYQDCMAR